MLDSHDAILCLNYASTGMRGGRVLDGDPFRVLRGCATEDWGLPWPWVSILNIWFRLAAEVPGQGNRSPRGRSIRRVTTPR